MAAYGPIGSILPRDSILDYHRHIDVYLTNTMEKVPESDVKVSQHKVELFEGAIGVSN